MSADSFQSVDTLQQLRQKGFATDRQSIDKTPIPYDVLKQAMYDGRVDIPHHEVLQAELVSLERNARTGKIDHRPGGSKDLADALAGVVYGLTMQRAVWLQHSVNPFEEAPALVTAVLGKDLDVSAEKDAA